jgi:hypothetical protein
MLHGGDFPTVLPVLGLEIVSYSCDPLAFWSSGAWNTFIEYGHEFPWLIAVAARDSRVLQAGHNTGVQMLELSVGMMRTSHVCAPVLWTSLWDTSSEYKPSSDEK